MSQSTGSYSLAVLGLTSTQRMVLASLCRLSRNRAVTYTLLDPSHERNADIVLVNADDPEAKAKWNSYANYTNTPVVFVSAEPPINLGAHQYGLARNHLTGGLLQLLDRIAANELDHKHEVIVSDHVSVQGGASRSETNPNSAIATALVIDDSLSVRTQMDICLQKLDIAAEVVEDANQGLEKLNERDYDIVFLDVILPDMDGYQVCKLIKRDPRTRQVPVVMLTSKGSAINKIQGTIAGCDRYLTKPASEKDVVEVVKNFLPNVFEHAWQPT